MKKKKSMALLVALSSSVAGLGALIPSATASTADVVTRQATSWENVKDSDGTLWFGRGGSFDTNKTATALAGRDIAGTTHDPLYYTSTWDQSKWSTTVPAPGDYKVTLYMAEDYHNAAGKRVFDVTAEGITKLAGVDIFKATGGKARAYEPSFTVKVTDGHLDLGWLRKVDSPMVNAIKVEKVTATNSITVTGSGSGDSFGFDASSIPTGGSMAISWKVNGVASYTSTTSKNWWSGSKPGWTDAQAVVKDSAGKVVATSPLLNPTGSATPTTPAPKPTSPTTPAPTPTPTTPPTTTNPVPVGSGVAGTNVRYAANNVFQMDLSKAPVAGDSSFVVNRLVTQVRNGVYSKKGSLNVDQYNWAYNDVSKRTDVKRVDVVLGGQGSTCPDVGQGWVLPDFYGGQGILKQVPIPNDVNIAKGTDGMSAIYDGKSLWEFWQLKKDTNGVWHTCHAGKIDDTTQSRAIFNHPYGVSASGVAMTGSSLSIADVRRGYADHILGIAVPYSANEWVWPANRTDTTNAGTNGLKEGTRLRLPANFDIAAWERDHGQMTQLGRLVANTAKKYGILILDQTHNDVIMNAEDGEGERKRTGINPWWDKNTPGDKQGFIHTQGGGAPWEVFNNFPWEKLEVVDYNYGK